MITGITLILLSLIAVPSIILAKQPNAQELLDKLVPYQGWIGFVFTFWGVYGVIFSGILGLSWMSSWPIFWFTLLAVNVMQVVLGFMLGYGLISKYIFSSNVDAQQKGAELLAKLAPIQGRVGLVGVGVGVWAIVASVLFHSV